ncbi:MAG: threonine synthase [Dethiobacter sp.]|nr:threonine synthase [Dethiobacter sp.]
MKELTYKSTRGETQPALSAEAIVRGLAADGGLFVPAVFPAPVADLAAWTGLTYQELAWRIMQPFLPDFSAEELQGCLASAYDAKFDTPLIAPLVSVADVYFLELFHGPTFAFKDMALSILPHLLKKATEKLGLDGEVIILTATSGDTGKAALEGFAGVPGTKIIVFFPEYGVSEVQKRQMITQQGENTYVIGIKGNFDDAQSGVKAIFADTELRELASRKKKLFSSANSINIGRLIPQVVYYFFAYLQMVASGALRLGEEVNFAVPTGNFGNILAGWYAKKMGLPVGKLLCAANENKVLADFLATGVYDKNRRFITTMSPSMDILVSSNLERLLYEASGEEGTKTRELMRQLDTAGRYEIGAAVQGVFRSLVGGYASETETAQAIHKVYTSSAYLMDPHTAVAYAVWQKYRRETSDQTPTIVVATASPYKFPRDVLQSIEGRQREEDDFSLINELGRLTGTAVPPGVRDLASRPIRHRTVCRKEEMRAQVSKILHDSSDPEA